MKTHLVRIAGSCVYAGAILLGPTLQAQRLPSLSETPWTGIFSGHQERGYEFGINDEGQMELILMDRNKQRVSHTRIIRVLPQVMIENDQGNTYYRSFKEDEGFATSLKAGLDHEDVKFTAETPDGTKVEVTVKYDRSRIILDGKVLDKGDVKGTKVFFAYKVRFPSMYPSIYTDEKKAKTRMRKDRVRFIRAKDGKRVMLKTYEEVEILSEENAKGGIRKLESDMDGQEGKKLIFETLDKKGAFTFKNPGKSDKGKLWEGFELIWSRPMGDTTMKPFVIEVK
ncbi:MAG: hypothetical protein H7A51_20065 [Akkermansiaceae bacterium]|nr:hypothetical protein [Akkermansiaceae bacterium]